MRARLIVASGLQAIASLLELVGLGLIFPIVMLIQDDDLITSNELAASVSSALGINTAGELVTIASLALVAIVIFRGIYVLAVQYWISKIVALAEKDGARRLYSAYLHAPITLIHKHDTGDIIRTIYWGVAKLYTGTLLTASILVSEFTLLLGILTVIFVSAPLAASGALLIIAILALVYRVVFGKQVTKNSQIWLERMGDTNKALLDGLGGIVEIKTFRKHKYILNMYNDHRTEVARRTYVLKCLNLIPRMYVEIILALGVSGFLIVSVGSRPGEEIVALLAFYGVAALRLMPSTTRIIGAINELKAAAPGVELVQNALKEMGLELQAATASTNKENLVDSAPLRLREKLSIQNLTYAYDGAAAVLDDVSFDICRGESIGIVGASGAGKSTLAGLLLGLLPVQSGTISIDEHTVSSDSDAAMRSMSYVPQHIFLLNDTIRANIAFGIPPENVDERQLKEVASMAQLDQVIQDAPNGFDTVVGERGVQLSGGQRQRIGIARALYTNPDIIILDEATSALDVETESLIADFFTSIGGTKTLVVIAHRLSTLRDCDRLLLLSNGKLIGEGTFDTLQETCPEFATLIKLSKLTESGIGEISHNDEIAAAT